MRLLEDHVVQEEIRIDSKNGPIVVSVENADQIVDPVHGVWMVTVGFLDEVPHVDTLIHKYQPELVFYPDDGVRIHVLYLPDSG